MVAMETDEGRNPRKPKVFVIVFVSTVYTDIIIADIFNEKR